MSERMTSIRPLDTDLSRGGIGFMHHGRRSRQEMINAMRAHYAHLSEQCQYVLNAKDEEFIVETHTGVYVKRDRKEIL